MGPQEQQNASSPGHENKCSRYIAGTNLLSQKNKLDKADEKAKEAIKSEELY
jgi:hypothetical protein